MYNFVPRVPAELADMVLDQLSTDVDTLRKASTVCKAWLPRSRVHLFRKVCVTSDFDEFLEFLRSETQVQPYIRTLVLKGPDLYEIDEPQAPQTTLPPHTIADIVALLPRLEVLQLQNVSLHDHKCDGMHAAPAPLFPPRTLGALQLMNVGSLSDTTNDIFGVLGLFSEIHFLHLAAVAHILHDPTAHAPQLPDTPLPQLRVHALKLEDTHTDIYYKAIRATDSKEVLRRIEVECSSDEHATALAEFLEYAGGGLEHLALDFTHCFRPDEDADDGEEIILAGK